MDAVWDIKGEGPFDHYAQHFDTISKLYQNQMDACGYDRLIIAAGSLKPIFLDDKYYPFKANPHFCYWVPLPTAANSFLVLHPGRRPLLIIHQPPDYWEKTDIHIDQAWAQYFEITITETHAQTVALIQQIGGRHVACIGEPESLTPFGNALFGDINPKTLLDHVHYHRAVKTTYEQRCLHRANRRAIVGHTAARQAFLDRASEFEIHLAYMKACQHLENELPYTSIVCQNENGSCLHYRQKSRERPVRGQNYALTIDAGAQVDGYVSDITRSHAGSPDDFSDLIAALDKEQQHIVSCARPGIPYADLNRIAHQKIAGLLHDFGFVDLAVDSIVESRISNVFFPHGVGHFIGLQVHDSGGFMQSPDGRVQAAPEEYPALRLTRTLEPGHVLTIEPGLYFVDMLLDKLASSDNGRYVNWDRVNQFRKYGGARVEDNIIITKDEPENMTREACRLLAVSDL